MLEASFRRYICLAGLLAKTAGKNALRSSLPLYTGVGIGALVLFAGNGLDAKTVVVLATERPLFGLALTVLWVLVTLPAARALLGSPETFFLRALPIARSELLVLAGTALMLAHVPWIALWARGGGPSASIAATTAALAIQVHVLAGVRSLLELATLLIVLVTLAHRPTLAAALIGTAAFAVGLRRAWARAPEPRSAGRHSIQASSRPLALASALAVSVYRGHGPVVVRALLFAVGACVAAVLGLRNNQLRDPTAISQVALAVWGPACVFGVIGIAGPVLSAEARARWILQVCGVSSRLRSGSAVGLLAAWAFVLGAAYGAVIGEGLALGVEHRARLVLENATAGAAWAGVTMSGVRITRTGGGRDTGRLLLGLCGLCVLSAVLLAVHPAVLIALMGVLAGALALVAARVSPT